MQQPVPANPFHPEFRANPYALYQYMRTLAGVHYNEYAKAWILLDYADCDAALRNPKLSSDFRKARAFTEQAHGELGPVQRLMASMMVFADPPDHTRLRGLVSHAFLRRLVEDQRPTVESIVDELFDGIGDKSEFDLIADVAFPLPIRVITSMLGVPAEDGGRIREWTQGLAPVLDPTLPASAAEAALNAQMAFLNYLLDLIDERRRRPGDDLVSRLIAAGEDDQLSAWELVSNIVLLLIAGHETTMNLLGNGTLALLRNPQQLAWLRAQPERIPQAIEELIRFDCPVHLTGRNALEAMEVQGHQIEAGDDVVIMIGAANRDPKRFERPDELLLERADNHHLGFGLGVHFCLGAPLARLEAPIALGRLLERYPELELAEEPKWRPNITLRGLRSLRLRARTASMV